MTQCIWSTGCSDSERCSRFGSCVAAAQSGRLKAQAKSDISPEAREAAEVSRIVHEAMKLNSGPDAKPLGSVIQWAIHQVINAQTEELAQVKAQHALDLASIREQHQREANEWKTEDELAEELARLREENRIAGELNNEVADLALKHGWTTDNIESPVAKLRARIATLEQQAREMRQWIPVDQAKPADNEEVLIYFTERNLGVQLGRYIGGLLDEWRPHGTNSDFEASHWMPLPGTPATAATNEGGSEG